MTNELQDLQNRIRQWSQEAFSGQTQDSVAKHLNEERCELASALIGYRSHGDAGPVREELADCWILCAELMSINGWPLGERDPIGDLLRLLYHLQKDLSTGDRGVYSTVSSFMAVLEALASLTGIHLPGVVELKFAEIQSRTYEFDSEKGYAKRVVNETPAEFNTSFKGGDLVRTVSVTFHTTGGGSAKTIDPGSTGVVERIRVNGSIVLIGVYFEAFDRVDGQPFWFFEEELVKIEEDSSGNN